jgi:prepilin-type N-terminal cleavage/methylation domain-containing protein
MEAVRKAAAALRREERGFTLIELLVATGVGLVVVGGALTIFVSGIRSEPRTASQVTAIQQARVTLDRITRELRQGSEVPKTPTASSSRLAIVTYVKAATCGGAAASTAIPCRVTYECSAGQCTRVVSQPNGTGPGPSAVVASGLTTANVFSYLPDEKAPTYVGVTFSFDSGAGEPVTLGDGVALRNLEEEDA